MTLSIIDYFTQFPEEVLSLDYRPYHLTIKKSSFLLKKSKLFSFLKREAYAIQIHFKEESDKETLFSKTSFSKKKQYISFLEITTQINKLIKEHRILRDEIKYVEILHQHFNQKLNQISPVDLIFKSYVHSFFSSSDLKMKTILENYLKLPAVITAQYDFIDISI